MVIVDAATVSLEASFVEPPVTTGAPLAYYFIQYSVAGGPLVPGAHIAAAPAGGQTESGITMVVPAPDGVATVIDFTAVAVDVNGKQSAPSNDVKLTINRVGPLAPTNFTIA